MLALGKRDPAKAEAARKTDLAAKLARMDATELTLYANQIGARVEAQMSDEDIRAAIELTEENAAKAEADRVRIAQMEADEGDKIITENDGLDATSRAIRRLNTEFCRHVPQNAVGGSYEPGDDERFTGEYDVPNGKYRVTGSEWVFEIKKKALVSVVRAVPENNYGGKAVVAV